MIFYEKLNLVQGRGPNQQSSSDKQMKVNKQAVTIQATPTRMAEYQNFLLIDFCEIRHT